jgi:hypothetical protein
VIVTSVQIAVPARRQKVQRIAAAGEVDGSAEHAEAAESGAAHRQAWRSISTGARFRRSYGVRPNYKLIRIVPNHPILKKNLLRI